MRITMIREEVGLGRFGKFHGGWVVRLGGGKCRMFC